ncbi:dephospho-CoA kinase [Aquibium carbonis]|uniref:Dephospho-CoA kinase n=1 Tax=Aquibium carbonis TaxID=2495581 RepID=A0A429Z3C3_9HYPH|nr:dephospho-CoA kinase [Aquibium carbonis]RST88134.1 dephospho-CoA kinase [Aquibium carbonis]
MIILGLTGSIGMGKSTTAAMFEAEGIPVNDADAVVHELYRGKAVQPVGEAFPEAIVDGAVDRNRLSALVLGNPVALKRLESIVHPLVRGVEMAFLDRHRAAGTPLVVLDIPLLFEVGAEGRVDRVAVVTAPADVQQARVLARPGMTQQKFDAILSKQVPDAEKRARADFVIDTGQGMEPARQAVRHIIGELTGRSRS